jgi:hypothetical protein
MEDSYGIHEHGILISPREWIYLDARKNHKEILDVRLTLVKYQQYFQTVAGIAN